VIFGGNEMVYEDKIKIIVPDCSMKNNILWFFISVILSIISCILIPDEVRNSNSFLWVCLLYIQNVFSSIFLANFFLDKTYYFRTSIDIKRTPMPEILPPKED
jgi:hypothetical protein